MEALIITFLAARPPRPCDRLSQGITGSRLEWFESCLNLALLVQLHGGIGFTWEHHAHLYFKRARASAILLGTASELTDLIGRQPEAII